MQPSEPTIHRLLVNALASAIAWEDGIVEQARGFGTLQSPKELDGSQPDVMATGADGAIVIGEAKTAAGAKADAFPKALADFRSWAADQDRTVRLALAVPTGVGEAASRAAAAAGWDSEVVQVVEVDVGA